jgi:hypothetical protein
MCSPYFGGFHGTEDQVFHVGFIGMIGDPDGSVPGDKSPPDNFRVKEHSVACERMSVQIDHGLDFLGWNSVSGSWFLVPGFGLNI